MIIFRPALIAVSTLFALTAGAQIQFEDVSEDVGMGAGFTETWGGSWGDINGDNWPDLFNQGHREYPRMFRNSGEGTFEDIAYEVDPGNWIDFPFDDKHGASWVDFDNDGDDDLLLSVSATGPGQFLVNTDGNGGFVDRAVDADLDDDSSARLGVWFDYNNDGHLDVAQGHTKNSFLRYRDPDDATNPDVDFDNGAWDEDWCKQGKLNYHQLMDINNDGQLDILCMQEGVFPLAAYDYSTYPFTDITTSFPTVSHVNDTVVADFDGDLRTDMIMTRGAIRPSGAVLVNSNHIEAWLRKDDAVPAGKGFSFESNGPITVYIDHKGMCLLCDPDVYNMDPITNPSETLIPFPDDSPLGTMTVEWVPAQNHWRVTLIDTEKSFQTYIRIDTDVPVSNLVEIDFDVPEAATETVHLVNTPAGFVQDNNTGLFTPDWCVSLVAGDFDNDMDQDLYLVCRRGPSNLTNRMYENQGDGTFIEVLNHGAEGPVGTDATTIGLGESVVTADYDVDGFLDLYLTNGLLYYPINKGGPEQLFRNKGNSNHWLEIDLQGTTSNRDGIGAKVYVTAGGITQLREQNGGYHRWSQNDRRLHIGLAGNATADVTIEWPSGTVDNFVGVAADQLYNAVEGGSMTPAVLGPPVHTELQPGDECGQPPYHLDYGPVVLLWKSCATGVWSIRMKGGASKTLLTNSGQILADGPFSAVAGFNLNGSDDLDNATPETLLFSVSTWFANNKGFSFSTAGQSTACLSFNTQDIPTLIVGGTKKKIVGGIDLVTLMSCDAPPPPPNLIECGPPDFDNATENALFAWRDCNFLSTSSARWNFALSAGGAPWGPYTGLITSDFVIGATALDIEPNDTLDTLLGDFDIDFTLNVGGTGVDSFRVDVPVSSKTCLQTDTLPAGTPVLLGKDKLPWTDDFDLMQVQTDCNVSVGCH